MALLPTSFLDAGTVLSLSSLIPGSRRGLDLFKENEKLRENARTEYTQNREVAAVADDHKLVAARKAAEQAVGTTGAHQAPLVGSGPTEGAVSLASIKPIMVR